MATKKEGLKADGTLKKGYRWGKGGKILKASTKPKTKKATTKRRPTPQVKGKLSKTVLTQHFEPS